MSTTTTARPANGAPRMPGHRVLSYALGDAANNLSFLMTSMFLMMFMTEIAGLTAGVAGAIYGITKIWAGVSDLVAGQTVDRFDTRWGRLRPWVMFGSFPLIAVFVALFSAPAGLSTTATIAWIFLFDAAFQLAYSFVNIPYGSLSAAMTQDPVDRSKLSGARSIANAVTGVVLSAVVSPQFQDTTADGVRLKFTITCLLLGILAIILYGICFANTRETVPRSGEKISFKRTFRMLRQNRPLIILCLGAFFQLAAMFTMNAVAMYFTRYVLGNAGWYTYLMLAQTVGTILAASFIPMMTTRFGKRNSYLALSCFAVAAYALIFLMPSGSLAVGILAWFIFGVGTGGTNALLFSMQADTVDYGEWKSGIRAEGGSYSMLSFIRKCGQGIGGWISGVIIGGFGYVANAPEQSEEALRGIRIASGAIPAGFTVCAILVILAYPLGAALHERVVTDLNDRRTQQAVAASKGVPEDRVRSTTDVGDGRSLLMRGPEAQHPPIVTVFGQRGSGASEIAPMLARELGVDYIGQRFTSTELAQVDKDALISDSAFDRWMRSVSLGGGASSDLALASDVAANSHLAKKNTEDVLASVEYGGVLLGRNGALVLGPVVGVMHVRLVASMDKRIERVTQLTGLPVVEAEAQCLAEDRLRAEMSKSLYQWNPNNDEDYDLVINTGSVTYEQVVEFIAHVYRSKYPNMRPLPGDAAGTN